MGRKSIRLPVARIASHLRWYADNVGRTLRPEDVGEAGGIEVRLQVKPSGYWSLWFGASDYDTDHSGVWGSDIIPVSPRGGKVRFNSLAMARGLINQAVDMSVDGFGDSEDSPDFHYALTPKQKRAREAK